MIEKVVTRRFLKLTLVVLLTMVNANANKMGDFSDLVEKLLPVVVGVKGESDPKKAPLSAHPFGRQMTPEELLFKFFGQRGLSPIPQRPRPYKKSLGSGFIISSERLKGKNGNNYRSYIVTNNHVIADTDTVTIVLYQGENKKKIIGKIKGQDPRTDIAVIEIETKEKLPVAVWGDSKKTRVGSWSIAIGNPLGLGSTVTAGIISHINRDISADGLVGGYIQTDTAINMGNSGGPLFHAADGKVIGINTSIVNPAIGSGIAFAIPSDVARDVVDQLIKYGKTRRGWLGILMQEIDDNIADSLGLKEKQGALVAEVIDKSPAKGKLKADDVILEINGKKIKNTRDIQRIISNATIGKNATIVVLRSGKKVSVKVKIAEYEKAAGAGLVPQNGIIKKIATEYGLTLSLITKEIRAQLNLPKEITGVVVRDIDTALAYRLNGAIRPGDVIVAARGKKISTPSDIYDAFKTDEKLKRHNTLLKIYRGGHTMYVGFPITLNRK